MNATRNRYLHVKVIPKSGLEEALDLTFKEPKALPRTEEVLPPKEKVPPSPYDETVTETEKKALPRTEEVLLPKKNVPPPLPTYFDETALV